FFAVALVSVPPSPQIYTLSLHDALPICEAIVAMLKASMGPPLFRGGHPAVIDEWNKRLIASMGPPLFRGGHRHGAGCACGGVGRSEEHTSELQSRENLVCRLLLEKKKEK